MTVLIGLTGPVMTGLFSLAGVVVGAGATAGTTWWVQKTADRRATAAAARLVQDEIITNGAVLDLTSQRGKVPDIGVEFETWAKYRDQLARGLPFCAWKKVADTYVTLQRFRSVQPGAALPETGTPTGALNEIKETVRVLDPWTRGPSLRFGVRAKGRSSDT